MIDEDIVKMYLKAGEIAKRVREEALSKAKPGMKLLDLAIFIENRIKELGGEPAFPANLSVNHIAAHYTPVLDDKQILSDNDVLKIDIGVHVNGYIADTAATISFNPAYEPLLEASRTALEKALEIIKPGVRANEIGKIIEETIKSFGYKPIKNLTGHSMDQYIIHSGYTIPNYYNRFVRWKFQEGAYAIEPFATTGVGMVKEGNIATIFSLKKVRGRLSDIEKRIIDSIWKTRRMLPFCERWLTSYSRSIEGVRNILKSLIKKEILYVYPILVERANGLVSQFEHTVLITGKDIIVTTQ